ncbi:MAG: hypothetical protein LBD24_07745 [Spirochaetaceae bacterium]|nr:hypothetical protein [Spirochaetaceae bacterium]
MHKLYKCTLAVLEKDTDEKIPNQLRDYMIEEPERDYFYFDFEKMGVKRDAEITKEELKILHDLDLDMCYIFGGEKEHDGSDIFVGSTVCFKVLAIFPPAIVRALSRKNKEVRFAISYNVINTEDRDGTKVCEAYYVGEGGNEDNGEYFFEEWDLDKD